MKNDRSYIRYTKFVLFMVFLVILAGGVVRMTQSGMGCPDWPTCFGRWIPPLTEKDLPPDFEKYLDKQDIDHSFNVYHTWIEYINRLLGALLGFFLLIHFVWSYRKFLKTRKDIVYLSLFLLLLTGFQGWLGKTVVDANLSVVKITAHMLVAILIAGVPVMILSRLNPVKHSISRLIRNLTVVALCLVIVQIVLGTEVREQVDIISKSLGYEQRELWIESLDNFFIIHRSFSWVVGILILIICFKSVTIDGLRNTASIAITLLVTVIAAGLVMNFLEVPAIAQPIHLLAASGLAISIFSLRLQMK